MADVTLKSVISAISVPVANNATGTAQGHVLLRWSEAQA